MQGLALTGRAPLPRRLGFVPKLNAGLFGESLDCLGEVQVLDLAEKLDGVAAGSAAVAVVEALARRDTQGRPLVRVERADPHEGVVPGLFEREVAGDELDDVGPVPDRLDVLLPDPSGHAPPTSFRGCAGPGEGVGRG